MKKLITIEGKNISYQVTGNGSPVMLVHGFGENAEVWNEQMSFLQDDFQLIIPDLPGSGHSELIEDMSIEGMAETLRAIWDAERADKTRVALIGHSMGGYITLAFAKKYAHYLCAFGLFHSTAFADTEEKKAARRKGIEFIRQHGAFEFLKTSTPNLFSPSSKQEFPKRIDEYIQSLSNISNESLIAYYEAMIRRADTTDILRNTELPVLFIAGKYDNAVPLADILKQCHLPVRSYFHVLNDSAHMGMMEETEKSNKALKDFLKDTYVPNDQ